MKAIQDCASLRAEFWRLPLEALVDRQTVAAAFYLSAASMESLAVRGGGPTYTRIGRRALYKKSDALQWASCTGRSCNNTSQLAICNVAARGCLEIG